MDSITSAFHIDIKILVAQLINFGVVIFVLYRFAIKPLNKLMKERSGKIEKGLNDAKTNAETLLKTKEEYESALTEARKEANEIFTKARIDAESKKNEMLEDAKSEVASVLAQGRLSLEEEKRKMLDLARQDLASLVTMATEKVLTKGVTGQIDESIIRDSVKEFA